MFAKFCFFTVFLLSCVAGKPLSTTEAIGSDGYQVVKVSSYQGNDLEAAYRISYTHIHTVRYFEIIKTDAKMKNYFMADFLLVERVKSGKSMICYPTGWESLKAIKDKEVIETCDLVTQGFITPDSYH
jgi:hypothetical protein